MALRDLARNDNTIARAKLRRSRARPASALADRLDLVQVKFKSLSVHVVMEHLSSRRGLTRLYDFLRILVFLLRSVLIERVACL